MSRRSPTALGLAPVAVTVRRLPGGGMVLASRQALLPYPRCLGELLRAWAAAAPDRPFLAERNERGERNRGGASDANGASGASGKRGASGQRDASGGWRRIGYGAALAAVERIAGALLARGLDRNRPVAILSENGIDNGLLQLAAMHVGIPVAPISPAYSLLSRDHAKLRSILQLTRPGLVYAGDGAAYAPAFAAVQEALAGGVELAVSANPPAGQAVTGFDELLERPPGPAVAARFAAVGPDTPAKILFTSGSTGVPKGVVNTQRMMCSNQQAIAQVWPFLAERPPVIVDWLPWSHTFGGNHNFNMMLRNGGTLYVDGGKPAPGAIAATVENLREVPSTIHFNVPRGFDMLIPYLESDAALRATFFRDLDVLFYAAAALPPHLWQALERLSDAAAGRRVTMLSAWGSTETAPTATSVHFPIRRAGVIGLPVPGTEIKLVPAGGKLELRVRGPNVTPGYWQPPDRQAASAATGGRAARGLAAEVFDEDGFLATGDAGKLADPRDPSRGLAFDGRLAEDFKLTSGTWVHVGELRTLVASAGAPVVQEVVVTGHGRAEIGLLVFPNPAGCRSLCRGTAPDAPLEELIRRPEVRRRLRAGLAAHNAANPASSRRIGAALLLAEPPSIDAGEITDKGYVNQSAVLAGRAALVERLHGAEAGTDAELIRPDEAAAE
ncbi:MAG TPA: feruloyl-CoA synthase [Thermoanaerobaculia bacterium]|nr:feruloyl-CoA synthase [Thermoanaerobaculia bacterium]